MLARAASSLVIRCLPLLALALPSLVACGGPSVELSDDTLSVVHVSPSHGTIEVRRDPMIAIGFSDVVDEASLDESLALVSQDEGGGTKAVEFRVFVDDTGAVVTLAPDNVLDARTLHRLVLTEGLRAASGAVMAAPFRSEFMTRE